jgi:endonuclease/exonuclease/phosphatase family metal-dependent hydrolase
MKVASYNVENMFDRAKAMNMDHWAEGRPALEAHQALNALFNRPVYSDADKQTMLTLLNEHGMLKSDEGPLLQLRKIRGQLIKRPRSGNPEIVARGRDSWIGWAELKSEPVEETATENTARVIVAVDADILGVVEAEDRTTLRLFNESVIRGVGGSPYSHTMVINGNDERGIDVGILTKGHYEIVSIRTHVFDEDTHGRIFSRDCAEYEVSAPGGQRLWILVNHLKSKGYGSQVDNDAKRKRQAVRIRAIVDRHRDAGEEYIVVLGDFNDIPTSEPLEPLLGQGSFLKDIREHPAFVDGGRPGTYGNCTASEQFDYLLLSPALFDRVIAGSYDRRGMWGGKNGDLWPHLGEVKSLKDAASDHAAVWAEMNF